MKNKSKKCLKKKHGRVINSTLLVSDKFKGSRATIVVLPDLNQHLKIVAAKRGMSVRNLVDKELRAVR